MGNKKCMGQNEVWIPRKDKFYEMQEYFKKYESRNQFYPIARKLVERNTCFDKAIGVSLFLSIWNAPAYKNGIFEFDKIRNFIETRIKLFNGLIKQDFEQDFKEDTAKELFTELLGASKYPNSKGNKWKESPVGVSKALHLICPNYFPIWDSRISEGYGIDDFRKDPENKYVIYCRKILKIINELKKQGVKGNLLKKIDEFNYSVFVLNKKDEGDERKKYFNEKPVEI